MNEILNHKDDKLSFLLCGKMPHISSSRRKSKNNSKIKKEEPNIDLTAFPPEIKSYRNRRPNTVQQKLPLKENKEFSTKKFELIHENKDLIKKVEANLVVYKENHQRKVSQIHQDWEERYMNPYNERMKNRLFGEKYDLFKTQKLRSITATGDRPTLSTLSLDEPVDFPKITLGTKGLEDKVHKYHENNKKEQELTKFIQTKTGNYIEPPILKERNTVDLVAWRLQPETKFYCPDKEFPKGKKQFELKFKSTLNKEMNQFYRFFFVVGRNYSHFI